MWIITATLHRLSLLLLLLLSLSAISTAGQSPASHPAAKPQRYSPQMTYRAKPLGSLETGPTAQPWIWTFEAKPSGLIFDQ